MRSNTPGIDGLTEIVCYRHSFKSPAIAEDIAGYSCLRLVKLRAIARYIPLYLYLASAYCCFGGHPLHTHSQQFKTLVTGRVWLPFSPCLL
jgi:hypothetical protein